MRRAASRFTARVAVQVTSNPYTERIAPRAVRVAYQTALRGDNVLATAILPDAALALTVVLAAYARYELGYELVDDYPQLLLNLRQATTTDPGACQNQYLWFANCILIADENGQEPPSSDSWTAAGVPELYNYMTTGESR